jgi:hypothetical protein
MLLEQGCYQHAVEYLERQIVTMNGTLGVDEMQLLRLMNSLASIYWKGALRFALVEVRRAWKHLERITQGDYSKFVRDPPMSTPLRWKPYIDLYSDMQVGLLHMWPTSAAST